MVRVGKDRPPISQQRTDKTLVEAREWAAHAEKGYVSGRMVCSCTRKMFWNTQWHRYLRLKKTHARLRKHFTQHGMAIDVRAFCTSCATTELFRYLTFDLVEPLLQTRQGNKYLLTMTDCGSKFPDGIPLEGGCMYSCHRHGGYLTRCIYGLTEESDGLGFCRCRIVDEGSMQYIGHQATMQVILSLTK